MTVVDVVFRNSTWEGYESHVRTYKDEALALHAIADKLDAPNRSKSYVHKILISRPADDEFTLDEVKKLITDLSDEALPESLFAREKVKLGSYVFTSIAHSPYEPFKRESQDIWVVFEYRGKTYKWEGRKHWSGSNWNDVNTLTETRSEEKVHTVTTWV